MCVWGSIHWGGVLNIKKITVPETTHVANYGWPDNLFSSFMENLKQRKTEALKKGKGGFRNLLLVLASIATQLHWAAAWGPAWQGAAASQPFPMQKEPYQISQSCHHTWKGIGCLLQMNPQNGLILCLFTVVIRLLTMSRLKIERSLQDITW